MKKTSEERYVIRDCEVWHHDRSDEHQDVIVRDGILSDIVASDRTTSYEDYKEIPASGLQLLPAGVDPQVHLRVPGQPEKETAETGLNAALRGGVLGLLTMPNTKPVIDSPAVVDEAMVTLAPAVRESGVEVLLSSAITHDLAGKSPVDFIEMANTKIAAYTDDGLGVVSDDIMRQVFAASEKTGLPVLQHAEYPDHPGVLAAGPVQERLGIPAYPESAEVDMVERDLRLLEDHPQARYHVLHVSSAKTLELVSRAKAKGLRVTCEASPHHLALTSSDIVEEHPAYKMNPPLRQGHDRQALQAGLETGLIDFVATDHAPHEAAAKTPNFKTSAYGTTGLETSLRVLLDLYQKGQLSQRRLVSSFSYEPARFLALDERGFGTLTPKKDFRALLVNARSTPERVELSDLESKSANNCFLGRDLPPAPKMVFCRKSIVDITG